MLYVAYLLKGSSNMKINIYRKKSKNKLLFLGKCEYYHLTTPKVESKNALMFL